MRSTGHKIKNVTEVVPLSPPYDRRVWPPPFHALPPLAACAAQVKPLAFNAPFRKHPWVQLWAFCVSDLVGNHEPWFSRDAVHIKWRPQYSRGCLVRMKNQKSRLVVKVHAFCEEKSLGYFQGNPNRKCCQAEKGVFAVYVAYFQDSHRIKKTSESVSKHMFRMPKRSMLNHFFITIERSLVA